MSYAGSSRALAVLERFEKDLPKGWDTTENWQKQVSQNIGTAFLKKLAHPYLKVPSAIVHTPVTMQQYVALLPWPSFSMIKGPSLLVSALNNPCNVCLFILVLVEKSLALNIGLSNIPSIN